MRRVPIVFLIEAVTTILVLVAMIASADAIEATPRGLELTYENGTHVARAGLSELGALELEVPERPRPRAKRRRSKPVPQPQPVALPSSVCSPDAPPSCNTAADCKGPVPDGAAWTCVRPWWAVESTARKYVSANLAKDVATTKVCAFGWAKGVAKPGRRPGPGTWRRQGQQRTREEIAAIVHTQCRGRCDRETLTAWLSALAMRESSLRPWVTHRLTGDESANDSAWAKMKAVYAANPHYAAADRWRGRGLLGQIAAYHLHTVDVQAAPEELCDPSFAVVSYLQRARSIATKQRSLGMTPTYASVAATIGTGKMRPSAEAIAKVSARLLRVGVNPDTVVFADDFGRPLPAGGPGVGGRFAVAAARSVVAALRGARMVETETQM